MSALFTLIAILLADSRATFLDSMALAIFFSELAMTGLAMNHSEEPTQDFSSEREGSFSRIASSEHPPC